MTQNLKRWYRATFYKAKTRTFVSAIERVCKKASLRKIKGLRSLYKNIILMVKENKPQILLRVCFAGWKKLVAKKQFLADALVQYEKHREAAAVRTHFVEWSRQFHLLAMERENILFCQKYYSAQLLRRHFSRLKSLHEEAKVPKACDQHRRLSTLSRCVAAWSRWTLKTKSLMELCRTNRVAEDKQIKRRYFGLLTGVFAKRQEVNQKSQLLNCIIKRKFLTLWAQSLNSKRRSELSR